MRTAALAKLILVIAFSWALFGSTSLSISEILSSQNGVESNEKYEELCQALNILKLNKLSKIPPKDLNGQLSSIMLWLINNSTENLLQELTNLYHPSPTDPTLRAYKSFIDALAQFFISRGESPEQARNLVFRSVAYAVRVIYEIYDNNGARVRALLELNSRTGGFGLIALAQLGQLRELALPNLSSDLQYQPLRVVPINNTNLQRLVDYIIGTNPNNNILNDLLRYYCHS